MGGSPAGSVVTFLCSCLLPGSESKVETGCGSQAWVGYHCSALWAAGSTWWRINLAEGGAGSCSKLQLLMSCLTSLWEHRGTAEDRGEADADFSKTISKTVAKSSAS